MTSRVFLPLLTLALQAQIVAAQTVAAAPTASQSSSDASSTSSDASGAAVDSNAGASGADTSSFSLSKGGLIAIIVVIVVVAIFGIGSTVLFVVAKRRQWSIRASIRRASRRLTGRLGDSRSKGNADRRSHRVGMVPLKGAPSGVHAVRPPGQKRGLVINVDDLEKGPLDTRSKTSKKAFVEKLWGNDWK
ncbi:Hypothetical protein R9X50_00534600 [Acrodontium crateriforme]|uniref:Uncharacterized protein n=1 Tax=Acrodontium crateriforme TaxID=150365 RepID=A0AAQ3M7N1_9PEZI|nr:Hypothetical protein R9X50_00534600 [Acrodontium crateriforme]